MTDEPPIACSLTATEMPVRRAEIADLARSLVDTRHEGRRAELRFAAGARDRVDRFAAAESECCPFFAMTVRDEPGSVVLAIDAPDGAEPVLAELVDAFR
jgi:hypothetical protein